MQPKLIFRDILPRWELREYVRLYHLRHFVFDAGFLPPAKPYPPRPEHTLMFYIRDRGYVEYPNDDKIVKRSAAVLCGQQVSRLNLCVSRDFLAVVVVFQPCMLYKIVKTPMHFFTNREIDLAELLPGVNDVNARLNSTDHYEEMIWIIEDYLIGRIRDSSCGIDRIDQVAQAIFRKPERVDLDWLASQSCYSTKQFSRKFNDRMGVSPKTFMRISRMYKSYNIHFKSPEKDWLTIALECGYHDYQHMVKDYKLFANVSPITLFEQDNTAPERLFGQREPGDHPEIR